MGLPGASCRRGVDVAHVVADLVRAQLRQLRADADPGGTPVARQHSHDEPADRQIDGLDQRLRERARALSRRRLLQQRHADRALTAPGSSVIKRGRSAPASGTAVTTRSSN